MSDRREDGSIDSEALTAAITSTYKVLGELTAHDGVGVLGQNNAGSGTPIGVLGAVPNTNGGFGLSTPDDARIEGAIDTNGTDWVVRAGTTTTGDAMNTILGHASNTVDAGVKGASIGGGGHDDGFTIEQNVVMDDYGTVAGGRANRAGAEHSSSETAKHATVGGGRANVAGNSASTVAGGQANEADGDAGTVGGGWINRAAGNNGTVGGGWHNEVLADHGTIGGGAPSDPADGGTRDATKNVVYDRYGTVGGGGGNQAGSDDGNQSTANYATVAGGRDNTASAFQATVGGGQQNLADGNDATVGGGYKNEVNASFGTIAGGAPSDLANPSTSNNVIFDEYCAIGGGGGNRAGSDDGNQQSDEYATIGGGIDNVATRSATTVGGGHTNTASGDRSTVGGGWVNGAGGGRATVAGGENNTANGQRSAVGGGFTNVASGDMATVPGGTENTADGNYSFAAGRLADTNGHAGTFVWSDSNTTGLTATGPDQFLVDAAGGVGIGEDGPRTQLHISDASSSTSITGNVVLIEDLTASNSRGLGIKTANATASSADHFVTFYDSSDASIGAIEGNGSGGVQYSTSSADYAEYLPRVDPDEEIEPGDVVGVVDGHVTKATGDADQALVVSSQPLVAGNSPGPAAEDRVDHEVCAFVGQVPVRVDGPADEGDLIVPSGNADGVGRAVTPEAYEPGDGPIVGRAWGSTDEAGVDEVVVAVGLETGDALVSTIERQQQRIRDLETELEAVENRIGSVETRLSAMDAEPTEGEVGAD